MGLQKKERVTYLKVTEGKLRMKTSKDDPQAEERYVELQDKYVYERVYTSCEGFLRDIRMQQHEEFGTSYNIIIIDPDTPGGPTTFSLNVGENSRYFQSFVMLLPNIDFSRRVEIRPYSFKTDGGARSIGISIKQDGEKVENYYKTYDEKTEKSTPKNGLEKFNFKKIKNDKDEQKILRIKLVKWLKQELKREVQRLAEFVEANDLPKPEVGDHPAGSGKEVTEDDEVIPRGNKKQKKTAGKKSTSEDDLY